jgi:hypothetical protein
MLRLRDSKIAHVNSVDIKYVKNADIKRGNFLKTIKKVVKYVLSEIESFTFTLSSDHTEPNAKR